MQNFIKNFGNNTIMRKFTFTMILFVALVFGFSASASAKVVTVQKGDSMWLIAKRYNVSFSEVLRLNKAHHIDVNLIHPNDKIYLPDGSTGETTVQSSDSDAHAYGNLTAVESEVSQQAREVLKLVNAERQKQGLKALTLNADICNIAYTKAKDMAVNNYFSHTSPTYGTPFEMLQKYGVTYRSAGENIAAGQKTADDVMTSWLNSSGHRANILNSSYTELGVGYYAGGSYGTEWVQLFIGK